MTDLLTAGVHDLRARILHDTPLTELRDEIVRQARAKWEAELVEVKRQAAWDALTRYARCYGEGTDPRYAAEHFRDHLYAPTPRSVTLPCGDVVTVDRQGRYVRKLPNGSGLLVSGQWPQLVRVTDTGADWDALKAFAASVEAR